MLAAVAATAGSAARAPGLSFRVFAHAGISINGIVWTGAQFLYVQNTESTVWSAPPSGLPIKQFATMPRLVEETRCVLSPGTHGWPAGQVFCHSPDAKIYEIGPQGGAATLFATLPVAAPGDSISDGALAFDDVGRFGYRLVAATGRSGSADANGGEVFAIDAQGHVDRLGTYPGPGSADELAIAPSGFGSIGGMAVLTVDPGVTAGTLVAFDQSGQSRIIAKVDDGLNPLAWIPLQMKTTGTPAPGLYITDDRTFNVYFAPAAQLAQFAGNLIVGSEVKAHFWVVKPRGSGFDVVRLRHNLRGGKYSLEASLLIG